MCINAAQEVFYIFREFIIYMNGIHLHFFHLTKWHFFNGFANHLTQMHKKGTV